MKETFGASVLKYTLYAVSVMAAVMICTLPAAIDWYFELFYDVYYLSESYRLFLVCFLMGIGILGEWIIIEMILMLRSISKGPFTMRNVKALRRVGYAAAVIAIAFFTKCISYFTLLTFIFGCLMVVCALFAFTLSGLFRQAVIYKEENDLTI